jgi:hypothetical protein
MRLQKVGRARRPGWQRIIGRRRAAAPHRAARMGGNSSDATDACGMWSSLNASLIYTPVSSIFRVD